MGTGTAADIAASIEIGARRIGRDVMDEAWAATAPEHRKMLDDYQLTEADADDAARRLAAGVLALWGVAYEASGDDLAQVERAARSRFDELNHPAAGEWCGLLGELVAELGTGRAA